MLACSFYLRTLAKQGDGMHKSFGSVLILSLKAGIERSTVCDASISMQSVAEKPFKRATTNCAESPAF